jgi:hypothetical protein
LFWHLKGMCGGHGIVGSHKVESTTQLRSGHKNGAIKGHVMLLLPIINSHPA